VNATTMLPGTTPCFSHRVICLQWHNLFLLYRHQVLPAMMCERKVLSVHDDRANQELGSGAPGVRQAAPRVRVRMIYYDITMMMHPCLRPSASTCLVRACVECGTWYSRSVFRESRCEPPYVFDDHQVQYGTGTVFGALFGTL